MNKVIFKGVLDGVVVDRIARDGEYTMPAVHFHNEYEIYYLFEGARYYFIGNKTYPINKGNLVLVDANQIHKTSAFGKGAHDRFLAEIAPGPFSDFFENVCGMPLQNLFDDYSGVWVLDANEQRYAESLMFSMMDEFTERRSYYQNVAMMRLAELALLVTRLRAGSRAASGATLSDAPKHAQIQRITEYISNNYNKVKTLAEICEHFYISKSHLCRIFKDVTGFTVQEYINMYCIKEARQLLEESDFNVSEISSALGYGTVTHFERVFKKYTETSPLKYRQKMRLIRQKVRERKKENGLANQGDVDE